MLDPFFPSPVGLDSPDAVDTEIRRKVSRLSQEAQD